MKLEGRRILVTGGAGFIGSHLVDALIEEGCFVRVLDNLSNGRSENLEQQKGGSRFNFILGNVLEPSDVVRAIEGIDIVFHLACLGVRHSIKCPFENQRVNAEGTLTVLREAHQAGVKKFVYCSSSEVYGSAEYVPMPETHPTHPTTVYGAGKLAGEAYTRAYYNTYGLNTVILRPFNTYGPRSHHEGDAGELIPKSVVQVLNKKPILIFGDGSQTRDYSYVGDIVKGIIEAAKCDEIIGRTFNIGSSFEISIKEIAKMILEMTGNSTSKIEYLNSRPGDVLRLHADSTVFRKIASWHPQVAFKDGLLKTIRWFESRPEGISTLLKQDTGINWE
jgi:UDP-glucose 4-epimerase